MRKREREVCYVDGPAHPLTTLRLAISPPSPLWILPPPLYTSSLDLPTLLSSPSPGFLSIPVPIPLIPGLFSPLDHRLPFPILTKEPVTTEPHVNHGKWTRSYPLLFSSPSCFRSSLLSPQGGAPRYDYPKEVWSPSGGWWAQPKTWKKNSLVIGLGTAVIIACTWNYSAKREVSMRE